MAPAHLLGRYLSLYTLTFTGSLALGPAIGGLLLQTNPNAIWWDGALAALLAGAVLLYSATAFPTRSIKHRHVLHRRRRPRESPQFGRPTVATENFRHSCRTPTKRRRAVAVP
jgi:MFS family permease